MVLGLRVRYLHFHFQITLVMSACKTTLRSIWGGSKITPPSSTLSVLLQPQTLSCDSIRVGFPQFVCGCLKAEVLLLPLIIYFGAENDVRSRKHRFNGSFVFMRYDC